MSKFSLQSPVIHMPNIRLKGISGPDYKGLLLAAWNWKNIDLDDSWYYFPEWADWDKIFQYVQKNLPKYVPDKFDCDNFAFYVSVMVAKEFGCNTCNVVEGYIDVNGVMKRHKWNVFFDGDSFYQLESQKYTPPNMIADLDDPGYVPDEIIAF